MAIKLVVELDAGVGPGDVGEIIGLLNRIKGIHAVVHLDQWLTRVLSKAQDLAGKEGALVP